MANQDEFASIVEQTFSGAELISVEPLTGGVSADVYRLDLCTLERKKRRVVLRIVSDAYARRSAELEFALLRDLFCSGLPVPKPILVDTACALLDRPYLIMSFVEGSTAPPETGMEGYIGQMAEMLARVHCTKTGVSSALPKRLDPMEEIFDFLPHGPDWDAARQLLSTLTDTEFNGLPKLLHGDFWPGNLLVANNRIAAVLDWEDAAIGDPISDVACTCLELRYIYGEAGMDLFRKAYSRHETIEADRLSLWLIYVASAAQKFMGDWNLDPSREAHMRQTALETIKDAVVHLAYTGAKESSHASV